VLRTHMSVATAARLTNVRGYCVCGITLLKVANVNEGDIMSSGTCGGTGPGRKPQEFMHPGDSVTVRVDRVGALTNPLVAGWAS
jgi:Fumarylacetoacetate (FAA) hydrolase family